MKGIVLLGVIFLASIGLVFASHTQFGPSSYGSPSYFGRPYQEQTNFFENSNFNRYQDSFNQNAFTFDFNRNFENRDFQGMDVAAALNLFQNQGSQSFDASSQTDFSGGYSFTKEPCATETIKYNQNGPGDWRLVRTICDGISGTFFRDNSLQNSLDKSGKNAFSSTSGYGQFRSQDENVNSGFDNTQAQLNNIQLSKETKSVETSFGKGSKVVFY